MFKTYEKFFPGKTTTPEYWSVSPENFFFFYANNYYKQAYYQLNKWDTFQYMKIVYRRRSKVI